MEIAELLDVSASTVDRALRFGRCAHGVEQDGQLFITEKPELWSEDIAED